MAKFTVDTHLFRELGELLVGRDSTALVELIKNSYDADATEVHVEGWNLDDPKNGRIVITDNGLGMTPEQFQHGFLRIASRLKEAGDRKSLRYRRRYTGAKGIGRLAAHKLAREIQIYSVPDPTYGRDSERIVDAHINWDTIESLETLDDIEGSDAISLQDQKRPGGLRPGTIIELKGIRRRWTPAERTRFLAEVQTFRPPDVLVNFPPNIVSGKLLFQTPEVYDSRRSDPGFTVNMLGDFETGEEYWQNLAQTATWLVEIDALTRKSDVSIRIQPTRKFMEEYPKAKTHNYTMPHPDAKAGPFFQSRFLVREGQGGKRDMKAWMGGTSGIRVFREGFRVLPYGEPKDDWLSLDADYKRRSKNLPLLSGLDFAGEPADEEEGLVFLGNMGYFGAVFLTIDGAPTLKMLINREGFMADPEYDSLVSIHRTAVYLSVRVRAAEKKLTRDRRSEEREERKKEGWKEELLQEVRPRPIEVRKDIEVSLEQAKTLARKARTLASGGDYLEAEKHFEEAVSSFDKAVVSSKDLISEPSLIRVLASVGLQMTAFVHEINGLLGASMALEQAMAGLRDDKTSPPPLRRKIALIHGSIGDLRRSIEKQASYLTDVTSPDARRRRSRQELAERLNAGMRLVDRAAGKRGIDILNDIPQGLKSPPMFPAELTLVFTNLLTNAVKAAGENGRIRARSKENAQGEITLIIENTGAAVALEDSERWFRPFESTTTEADPVLGQGMGMGLPITRNILEEYGAAIRFVKPGRGYSTALEITFPA